jgi:23S rRNA U2552 (ribose-2'-O)-methylase RlmE/FtsJ
MRHRFIRGKQHRAFRFCLGYSDLLKRLRSLFKTAKSYKPQACRSESFETYYVGMEKV